MSLFAVSPRADATSLDSWLTADDFFNLYISTDDNIDGTLFASYGAWDDSHYVSANLTPGVVNYLHLQVFNYRGPAGLLG
jgi:hypothetical protein